MPQRPPPAPRPHPPALPAADAQLTPSKSQRKRDAHALQALGVQLVALSAVQLTRLDLPETLHEAVEKDRALSPYLVSIGERAEAIAEAFRDRQMTTEGTLSAAEQLAREAVEAATVATLRLVPYHP